MSRTEEPRAALDVRRYRRYPAYKDSGVEWLGEIPENWQALPVRRFISRIEQGWSPIADDRQAGPDEWAVIKLSAVKEGKFLQEEHKALPVDLAPDRRYEIHEGDILLTRANTPDLVGDICVVRTVRPNLMLCDLVYRLEKVSSRFASAYFVYWFMSRLGRHQIEIDARGSSQSMVKVSQGHIRAWTLLLPPLNEQVVIAAFLDQEAARIDELIAKNERLIEVLHERRTALISRAVTRGLDLNVPVKDSGVEWLGEIPAHWEGVRMWRISRATSGGTPAKEERAYWNGEIPWVSPKDMKRRYIDSSEDSITERALSETGLKLIAPPVVLIVVRGMILAHSFPVAMTTRPVTINQDMKALAFRPTVDPSFMTWVFEGLGRTLLPVIVEEAAHGPKAIRMDEWRAVTIPLPPPVEQLAIAEFLEHETARIDDLAQKVRDAIDHLTELRMALISAAVTGKIDVRQEVA